MWGPVGRKGKRANEEVIKVDDEGQLNKKYRGDVFAPMVPLFGFWLMLVVLVVLLMFPHESREVGMPPRSTATSGTRAARLANPAGGTGQVSGW